MPRAPAIAKGGSTLRDYVDSEGRAGVFQQALFVYGRDALHLNEAAALLVSPSECDRACSPDTSLRKAA